MTLSNAYRADPLPARHPGHYDSTLPERLYSLSCLTDLCEIGHVLGAEVELKELHEHILAHLSRAVYAQGACLLLYHAAQQRFIPVASLGEGLPTAKLIAAIDWQTMDQQALHGPGETLATLLLDKLCIILVTLSYNGTLLGMVALSVADKNILVDERGLLLAFMGRVAALLLRNYDLSNSIRHDAISQERNRIAHELHNGITQQITHALHKLEYIQRLLETNYPQFALPELHHIQSTLNRSLDELRNTMSGLLPIQVEKVALVDMIRQMVNTYKSSHPEIGLVFKTAELAELQHLSPRQAMSVFQFIQESLANVWKHARATCVNVQLCMFSGWLVVEVNDNGIGFQAENVLDNLESINIYKRHFGLHIIRECIEETGGFWELQSRPGEGTTVRARFPMANPINELTKREREILCLVSEGLTNREIARRLEVSIDTVKTHIHHIMQKLRVKGRIQAIAVASRNGWL